jgi:hypothetical protein
MDRGVASPLTTLHIRRPLWRMQYRWCALGLLLLTSCDAAERQPTASTDQTLEVYPVWNLVTDASIEIGSRSEDRSGYTLSDVRGGRLLPGGGIVILDGLALEVRRYTSKGTLLWRFGRSGDGPGEFRRVEDLVVDSQGEIHVWDERRRIRTSIDGVGQLVRTTSPLRLLLNSGMGSNRLPDGSEVRPDVPFGPTAPQPPLGVARTPRRFVRYDPSGWRVLDTIGVFAGQENFRVADDSGLAMTPVIFGRRTIISFGPEILVVDTDQTTMYALDMHGDTVRSVPLLIPWVIGVRPAGSVERAARVEKAGRKRGGTGVSQGTVAAFVEREVRALGQVPVHDTLPLLTGIIQSADGNIWIDTDVPMGDRRWLFVINAEGRPTGRLSLRRGAVLLDARDGAILVLSRDDADVPTVTLHRIKPD